MLGINPRVLYCLGMSVVFFEFEVITDLLPVDFIEHLEVSASLVQPLEVLPALRAG
jgi:hypothetical protein